MPFGTEPADPNPFPEATTFGGWVRRVLDETPKLPPTAGVRPLTQEEFDATRRLADSPTARTGAGDVRARAYGRLTRLGCYAAGRWRDSGRRSRFWYRLAVACDLAVKAHPAYRGVP